jgi:hypothetical protein
MPQRSTGNKCRDFGPWFHGLGSATIQPRMEPSDIHLFPKLIEHLRRQHYLLDDEVTTAVKLWFRHQGTRLYSDGLMELLAGWRKCADREGDYMEK